MLHGFTQIQNITANNSTINKKFKVQQTVLGVYRLARSSTAISIVDLFPRFRRPSTFCGLAESGEHFAGFAFLGTRVAVTAHQPAHVQILQTGYS